jgi:hypothetical protein
VRFEGEICGFGTSSGHRIVVGRWVGSPFGPFADVMHEDPSGIRTLLAPSEAVAAYVATTYEFDVVRIVPVATERRPGVLEVSAGDLAATVTVGSRTPLGWALWVLPNGVARSRWWCTLVDPVARVAMRGVRTRGNAGEGRREFYGATDQHRLAAVHVRLAGVDLASKADVWPPVRFGFSSTPRAPSIVAVATTIVEDTDAR